MALKARPAGAGMSGASAAAAWSNSNAPTPTSDGSPEPASPRARSLAAAHPRRERLSKTSNFRGVSATENTQWRARIRFGKYTIHLGRFKLEREAAAAYDRAASLLMGPSAVLNFARTHHACSNTPAILHTAIIIEQALGADTPKAVREAICNGGHLPGDVQADKPAAAAPEAAAAQPQGPADVAAALSAHQQQGQAPLSLMLLDRLLQQPASAVVGPAVGAGSGVVSSLLLHLAAAAQQQAAAGAQSHALAGAVQAALQLSQPAALSTTAAAADECGAAAVAVPQPGASCMPGAPLLDLSRLLVPPYMAPAPAPPPLLPSLMLAHHPSAFQSSAAPAAPDTLSRDSAASPSPSDSADTHIGATDAPTATTAAAPAAEALPEAAAAAVRRAAFATAMQTAADLLRKDPSLLHAYMHSARSEAPPAGPAAAAAADEAACERRSDSGSIDPELEAAAELVALRERTGICGIKRPAPAAAGDGSSDAAPRPPRRQRSSPAPPATVVAAPDPSVAETVLLLQRAASAAGGFPPPAAGAAMLALLGLGSSTY